MAEEKAFEPTQGRLQRAKQEGDVSRSAELTATVSFACALMGVFGCAPLLGEGFRHILIDAAVGRQISGGPYFVCLLCVVGIFLCGIIGSTAVTFLQAGGIIVRFPGFKWGKLNPSQGVRRMFSREACVSAVKACATALPVTCALLPCIRGVFAADGRNTELPVLVVRSMESIGMTVVGLGAVFGIMDAVWEREKRRRRLRMSFEEIKREQKQHDGDPHLRGRRKQAHQRLLRGSLSRLRDAAFVVTNPTHIAVALEYRPPDIEVPRVLIRAVDEGALTVRQRAREIGVPLVENVALARALFSSTQVGSPIPSSTYLVVAKIVASLQHFPKRREHPSGPSPYTASVCLNAPDLR